MTPATVVSGAGASPWEATLIGGLLSRHTGVQVRARCFDVAQGLGATARLAPVLVIDADTYGAGVAQSLGLPEQPSLATAARRAASGSVDGEELRGLCHRAGAGLSVLAGVGPSGWADIRPASFRVVLDTAREAFALTVVDVGFCTEEDEELSFSGAPVRRNMATPAAIQAADTVVGA